MPSRREELTDARELLDGFIRHLTDVRRLSGHTARAYRTDIEAFLSWCELEGVSPLKITRPRMRSYMASMVGAGYADRTVNRRLSSLRTFYVWLEHEGQADAEVVTSMRSRKASKSLPRAMTDADASAMIDSCDRSTVEGLRDAALIELLYATGMRISEAATITVDDVDFAQGQVRVFGKGSKERIVPVYRSALDTLGSYLRTSRPQLMDRRKPGKPPATSVFVSTRGNDMSANALRARFELHARLVGLDPSVTPHAMRHTFATELLSGGADLKAVQELLGHESLATTQIYTHLSIERLKDATRQAHPRA